MTGNHLKGGLCLGSLSLTPKLHNSVMYDNLKTVANWAKENGLSRDQAYYKIKRGYVKTVKIDGIQFIKIK